MCSLVSNESKNSLQNAPLLADSLFDFAQNE